jgi:hypothetical protein
MDGSVAVSFHGRVHRGRGRGHGRPRNRRVRGHAHDLFRRLVSSWRHAEKSMLFTM